jgi:hypothetical protein
MSHIAHWIRGESSRESLGAVHMGKISFLCREFNTNSSVVTPVE